MGSDPQPPVRPTELKPGPGYGFSRLEGPVDFFPTRSVADLTAGIGPPFIALKVVFGRADGLPGPELLRQELTEEHSTVSRRDPKTKSYQVTRGIQICLRKKIGTGLIARPALIQYDLLLFPRYSWYCKRFKRLSLTRTTRF